jgi:Arc/MetJ-type ribon-helix-helix transcriptional regulator
MPRTTMRKVTFSLPDDLVSQLRDAVAEGWFDSQNEAVREALRRELGRAREATLRREFEQAAHDPLFLADLDAATRDFADADAESARLIPE